MEKTVDILGLGVATVDELVTVAALPAPNTKQEVLSRTLQGGGLTCTALVAAARLGCRCRYPLILGSAPLAVFLREALEREGIRIPENPSHPEAAPLHSLIIVERSSGERSILWTAKSALPPRTGPEEFDLLPRVKCLFVDHFYAPDVLAITRKARESGIDAVGDFERTASPESLELMSLVNHLILPLSYAASQCGTSDPEEAVRALMRTPGRELACVTDGARGSWYAESGRPGEVRRQPAFAAPRVVDTTGCGDVFHGVYAAGLANGLPLAERIRRASAAAAIKAGKIGAQGGAPRADELRDFLLRNG